MKPRTFLIGLDGATYNVLDQLMAQGVMPFLKSFLAGGVRAGLRSIIPALTPPAWTSLMTGKRPGGHGVFDFFRLESKDSLHIRFFTSFDVQSETLWSLASSAGMRVTVLNFPATFPAPQLPGYIIPGWIPWRQLRLACWPSDLFETLRQKVPAFNPRELAMDIGLEERATEGCSDSSEYAPWIELHTRREENWYEIVRTLEGLQPSELTAIVFDGVDKLQHLCWRFIRPEDAEPLTKDWEKQVRDLCLEYFRRLDKIIERLCDSAGPEATVIMASDHGFQASREVFHLNAWLAENGYLKWSDDAAQQTSDRLLGVGQVARHTWQMDWSRTTAFAATPTSNGVYIVVNRDGKSPGIDPADYNSFRAKLVDQLRAVRHPQTGAPIVENVWTKDQIFGDAHSDIAPDLTVTLMDGGLISILPSSRIVSPRPSVSGVHAPIGVFAARGPGIKQGVTIDNLSILDIAPIVLRSLGLAVPEDVEGMAPDSLYIDPVAARVAAPEPVKAVKSQMPNGMAGVAALSQEDEELVLARLRELGYLE